MLKDQIMEEKSNPVNKLALAVVFILAVIIVSFNLYMLLS
ncbi:hypothetical protein JCM19300_3846 [Algibacter lectus]|uniref:Uncharacterized protein n=1 Tax=Algibacter lectus TaxID=221126 RepID=A0A090WP63_9FLAO|nr:hypothetical protein JCM19300_3846 [Algibacter lectus]GAL78801.1 hypothetical protein JCM19274_3359 [Algibacter lectus]